MVLSPVVTIITVSLNSEKYIEDAIKSVLFQDYRNIEYWIIDGKSTDSTPMIVQKYLPLFKGRLHFLSEKDEGIYNAMNKGILKSKGEIIGILNSDDWYEKNIISYIVSKMCNYDMLHGNMCIVDKDNNKIKIYRHRNKVFWKYISTPFNHPTMFVKKYIYNSIGLFNEEFYTAADYNFMLKFCNSKYKDIYVDRTITNVRAVGITSSAKKVVNPYQIIRVLNENNINFFLSIIYVLIRYIREFLSKILNHKVIRKSISKIIFYQK